MKHVREVFQPSARLVAHPVGSGNVLYWLLVISVPRNEHQYWYK